MTAPIPGLQPGPDGKLRCAWGVSAADYVPYHDEEWGCPTADDRRLFEKMCLEGFQVGPLLADHPPQARGLPARFASFEPEEVARFGAREVTRLLTDAGIVRHRGKIESTIHNARLARELRDEAGSLAAYFWSFEPAPTSRPKRLTWAALRARTTTPESMALSKDLRKRGWTFVGPTTVYAFMQAVGIVNDHLDGCAFRLRAERARRAFERPTRSG